MKKQSEEISNNNNKKIKQLKYKTIMHFIIFVVFVIITIFHSMPILTLTYSIWNFPLLFIEVIATLAYFVVFSFSLSHYKFLKEFSNKKQLNYHK